MKTLVFNNQKKYQTIDNFGASACWWIDLVYKSFSEEDMEKIAELLFDRKTGAGLSCVRFNIGGGSAWYDKEYIENWMMRSECFQHGPEAPYDWTVHKGQQWLIKKASAMGVEKTVAFVNSPPAWMTTNGHTRGDVKTKTTNLKYGNEKLFGKFLADVMKHFEEIGLPFDYISPINEPQVPWDTAKQEGCRYSNEDTIRTVLVVGSELKRAGVSAKLLINESNNLFSLIDIDTFLPMKDEFPQMNVRRGWQFGGKYCEQIKDVYELPEIKESVAPIIAAHSYETDSPGMLSGCRRLLNQTLERYPGYEYWMTEYCILGEYGPKRDLGIDPALYISRVIHSDMTLLNSSAWQWWLAVSGSDYKDGLVYIDLDEEGNASGVYASKMLWALAHYSRFLRPGSVRVELKGSDTEEGLLASGYINTESKPVIVIVNTKDTSEEVLIQNVPDCKWKQWMTSSEEDMAMLQELSLEASFIVPSRSIMTLVGC